MTSLSASKNRGYRPPGARFGRVPTFGLVLLCLGFLGGGVWLTLNERAAADAVSADKTVATKSNTVPEGKNAVAEGKKEFIWFEPISDKTGKFDNMERFSLYAVLAVAVAGLLYAGMLVGQVTKADKGTPRMQEIAAAVREGANAYLSAQFRKIVPLILVITVLLFLTKWGHWEFAIGRSAPSLWARFLVPWSDCAA